MRHSRLRKFGKRGKKIVLLAQIAAIWYLSFAMVSYLTTDTGAYFNDVEEISGTISTAADFCAELNGSSTYWHNFCKDNAGLGNGPETVDVDTGEGTDPDNPGNNKEGCDDHTNANCSEAKSITNIKTTQTINSIKLTWANPTGNNFGSVNIYRNDDTAPIGTNITSGEFVDTGLTPNTKYIYKLNTIHKNGKTVQTEQTIEVTTNSEETEETTDKAKDDSTKDSTDNSGNEVTKTDYVPPAEVSGINTIRNGANVTLSWTNPLDPDFVHVKIYIDDFLHKENEKITEQSKSFKQNPNQSVVYKVTTVDLFGNESAGILVPLN